MLLVFVAGSALGADKPQDLIIGKWIGKSEDIQMVMDFRKDGTVTVALKSDKIAVDFSGTYKFLDESTIQTTIDSPIKKGEPKVDKLKIKSLDDTKFVFVGESGTEEPLTRVK
jgi:uncharacterized protein (TIGR03066 family)